MTPETPQTSGLNWRSIKKILWAIPVVIAGELGIQYTNLDWWASFILAIITGVAIYVGKNDPGTLTKKPKQLFLEK